MTTQRFSAGRASARAALGIAVAVVAVLAVEQRAISNTVRSTWLSPGPYVLQWVKHIYRASLDLLQEPRRDTAGDIINSHDGAVYNYGGEWVLYGTAYATCESFTNCSAHIGDWY